ncbi:hypothetical protein [Suttonella ornithocola]|uniref:Lipoprotein n=1 Tax=Suttonella ornithocola TaxID=279832 RepID=A0A380MQY6_9GAMM|nr:hypothetical protein [Suttonella ornithocola]SUO95010.1 Uncharacterised protein [Suttonella ornithocola]
MKTKILTLSVLTLLLSACGEKDQAYYEAHPEKAEEKINQCKENLMQAAMNKDREKVEKIRTDAECQAADNARRILREKQRAAEKAAEEQARKEMLAKAEAQFQKEYGNMDLKAYLSAYRQSECSQKWMLSLTEESAYCYVMQEHHKQMIDTAKADFENTNFDELIKQKNTLCKLSTERDTPCGIWQEALLGSAKNTFAKTDYLTLLNKGSDYCEEGYSSDILVNRICSAFHRVLGDKREAEIARYKNDDDAFVKAYEMCYQKAQTIKPESSWVTAGRTLVKQDDFCALINDVVSRRGLYDNNNFEKPL